MLFKGKNNLIGLDIGSSSVKLVELKKISRGFQLLNFGISPIHPEAIIDGAIMDSQAVVSAIKSLLEATRIRSKAVATSISGNSVIIKKIMLPQMTEEELEESIQWEAEQYIPFNITDVNLDFNVLRRSEADQAQMEVLLVAVKKEMIEDYSSVIVEVGLKPVIIDVSSFAVQNMYEMNYDVGEDECVVAVNVGANVMNINIFKRGISIFTRDVAFGGNQFNEEFQKRFNISYQEAEPLKLGGTISKEVSTEERNEIMEAVTRSLVGEAQRSLEFFSATSGEEKIDKIALCGGCAKLKDITVEIEDQIGIPAEVVNPFKRIMFNESDFNTEYLQEMAPLAGVGVGLALRNVGDK